MPGMVEPSGTRPVSQAHVSCTVAPDSEPHLLGVSVRTTGRGTKGAACGDPGPDKVGSALATPALGLAHLVREWVITPPSTHENAEAQGGQTNLQYLLVA